MTTGETTERIDRLEKTLKDIQERNARVEGDKRWETSGTRIVFITIMTYGIVAIFLYIIDVQSHLLSAIVPAMGYVLSTQSLPIIRRWWKKRF